MNEPSVEQQNILDFTKKFPYSLLVEALAGSGKTTTLIEILKSLPQASAIVLAFNTRIADEMAKRLPKMPRTRIVHVKTLHSAGLWITTQHFPRLKVDKTVSEELISQACMKSTSLKIRGAALKLLRLAKDFQHDPVLDADYAHVLASDFGVFDKIESGPDMQRVVEVTQKAYELSLNIAERDKIDFPDMTWLPLVLNLEPPHRYKAVLVDEAQDINPNQLAMVEKLIAPGGRIIACGDRNQAIYGWRGATPDETWKILKDRYKTTSMPLTITWRCDTAIVKQANQLVPDLKARAGAGDGMINHIGESECFDAVGQVDGSVYVLSRTNAHLLKMALGMWKRKIPFNITQSPEVIWPLKDITKKLCKEMRADRMGSFKQALSAWRMTENMKAEGAGSSTWAERIEEQFNMLTYCLGYVADPEDIGNLLDTIFSYDDSCEIMLSTVHKAKGLEADHVFLLRETFKRYRKVKNDEGKWVLPDLEDVDQEELNIEYVGVTRAKRELTWVYLDK